MVRGGRGGRAGPRPAKVAVAESEAPFGHVVAWDRVDKVLRLRVLPTRRRRTLSRDRAIPSPQMSRDEH